jgi:hypothetical protein
MTRHHESNDDICFDRLVDGELTGGEYRDLIASLDDEPGGWRRCALAFLEAQALGQEFRVARREAEKTATVAKSREEAWAGKQIAPLMLAMAASFVAAFGLGAWWRSNPGSATNMQSGFATQEGRDVPESMLLNTLQPSEPGNNSPAEMPLDRLTFVVDRGDGESERFEMPVYDRNDAYARELLERTSSLPPHIERAIRRSGYDVTTRREWAPVETRDGRRIIFPVDQLEITPVSGNVFQ